MTTLRDRFVAAIQQRRPRPSSGSVGAIDALRDSWSLYPGEWKADSTLNLGFTSLGEEWGGPAFADYIVELVGPHLGPDVDVLELGCGGGKFSQRLAPKCRSLVCADISPEMIEHTRETLTARGLGVNVGFQVLNGIDFSGVRSESADFIFSYDVLLHLQPQNVFSYLLDARRVLRANGVFMLHQINLASPGGLGHFLDQYNGETWKYGFDDARRRGHIYYMSPEQMQTLAAQAGLAVERITSDHGEYEGVTGGRDLIGFLRKRSSRLARSGEEITLIVGEGSETVFAVIDGERHAFTSAGQFERAGFDWDAVRRLGAEELAATPDAGPLEPWE